MLKRTLRLILLLTFSLAACSQFSPIEQTPAPPSGITGTVTEGPMCPGPVRVGDNSCPNQPYQATISVLNTDGTQVAKIQTDAGGVFQLELLPGTYILHPLSSKPLPRAADQTVEVSPGQFTRVNIIYDTGMR